MDGSGWYTSRPTSGNAGTWNQYTNWFSRSDSDNIIRHLQGRATGGTVNIARLDNRQVNQQTYYTWSEAQDTRYIEYSPGLWRTEYYYTRTTNYSPTTGNWGAHYSDTAYLTNYGGILNVTGNLSMTASYHSTQGTDSANFNNVPRDQLFSFTGTTAPTSQSAATANEGLHKIGAGTLSFQTNTSIALFIGEAGTLDIRGRTDGEDGAATDQYAARITSANVTLTGGTSGTIDESNLGRHASANFTFTSENDLNRWTITDVLGTVNTAGGINVFGYIDATNATSTNYLNATTNIGDEGGTIGTNAVGWLDIYGNTIVGNQAGAHVLNIRENGMFHARGTFTAGTVAGSTVYINDVWGGQFITDGLVNLATVEDSKVVWSISKTERTHTSGDYVVGAVGDVVLNLYTSGDLADPVRTGTVENAGILTSTGENVIFAKDQGSMGEGKFHGQHSGLFQNATGSAVIIGQSLTPSVSSRPNGVGIVDIYDFAKLFTDGTTNTGTGRHQGGGLIIAQEATAIGTLSVYDDGYAQSLGNMFVARDIAFDGDGVETSRAVGTLNVYADQYGRGVMEVGGRINLGDTPVRSNLVLAEAGTGTANIYNQGLLRVWGNMTVAQQVHLDTAGDEELGRAIGTLNVHTNARTEVGYETLGTGNMILAQHGTGTANIYNNSTLRVWGGMTVADKVTLDTSGDEVARAIVGNL